MAPLNYSSTAIQALQGADLTGKVAIVTGGNSGIGVETVRALATAGAKVILTSRSVQTGEQVAQDLRKTGIKGEIEVSELDLADLSNVKSFAKRFLATGQKLDFLVLNAGVMACPLAYTKDGFEMQIGTNHFGHFYLTKLLLPTMQSQETPSRVVVVSSSFHNKGTGDWTDLNYKNSKYERWGSYGQSKLANVLFAKELARRLATESPQVKAYSLHPGVIPTALSRHIPMSIFFRTTLRCLPGKIAKNVQQGAATTIYACVSEDLEDKSGAFLCDCAPKDPNALGRDMAKAQELWQVTEKMLEEALAKLKD